MAVRTSSTMTAGTPTARWASTAAAPAGDRLGGEVVPVDALTGQRGEQRARPGLARVDHDRAGDDGLGEAAVQTCRG